MKIHRARHPRWLKVPLPAGKNFHDVRKLIQQHHLHTVCQSAHCPNIGDCWGHRAATFMILGDICTRNCGFCSVSSGRPEAVDQNEPKRVGDAVKTLSLSYAVVTSVTRDDLADGGATVFADTIHKIRSAVPDCQVEVLIPDFKGSEKSLSIVINAKPDILNHNVETVPSLYSEVRPAANYQQSIAVLQFAKQNDMMTKTGLMLGLGETNDEVLAVMCDLRKVDCDILTLGQYLQPSPKHLAINRYVTPREFDEFKRKGEAIGFKHIESGPLVRSSYHAASCFDKISDIKPR